MIELLRLLRRLDGHELAILPHPYGNPPLVLELRYKGRTVLSRQGASLTFMMLAMVPEVREMVRAGSPYPVITLENPE